jgi:hypothetical protein
MSKFKNINPAEDANNNNNNNNRPPPLPKKSFSEQLEDAATWRKLMTPEEKWEHINEMFAPSSFAEFSQLPGLSKKRGQRKLEL